MPPGFDRCKSFGHDKLIAKHCYFRCSRPPDVAKFFDKDDQATEHCSFISMFCGLVIFIKNFDPINIRRLWAPEITIFCCEFIMNKTFKPIKTRRHWLPIWFHIFFSKACFSSWLLLFLHLGCFWLDNIHSINNPLCGACYWPASHHALQYSLALHTMNHICS